MEKIGDVFVNGMTPSQLDSLITVTYADIIRSPDVTVFIRSFGSYQAYILGQVNTPGGYPVERNFTLVQALAVAGGATNGANLSSIMILRQDQDNDISALKIDITDYLKGEPLEIHIKDKHVTLPLDDFFLQPHDIVYVPRTWIANTSEFLTQVYAGLIPPIDTYLRALLWSRR
jgi:polysaccharide export outer membrane protein